MAHFNLRHYPFCPIAKHPFLAPHHSVTASHNSQLWVIFGHGPQLHQRRRLEIIDDKVTVLESEKRAWRTPQRLRQLEMLSILGDTLKRNEQKSLKSTFEVAIFHHNWDSNLGNFAWGVPIQSQLR
ncbi:hypothetical protein PIB30_079894 [Stylosanthes scabra]|uniref:Uncharacterized protein n=1 Tax=Stylosanthes scabra TaxID=79078 RepID=A0ABU6RRH1_9FABA|nr:hypothetical protein [Stylosanthes scabra]